MSLFSFPKDPVLSKKWTEQVKRTRDKWLGPTKYSFLCSCHFTEDCFQPDVVVAASLGLSKRMKLKSDAIPTVFKRPVSEYQTKEASHLKKSKSTSRHDRYKKKREFEGICKSYHYWIILNQLTFIYVVTRK